MKIYKATVPRDEKCNYHFTSKETRELFFKNWYNYEKSALAKEMSYREWRKYAVKYSTVYLDPKPLALP